MLHGGVGLTTNGQGLRTTLDSPVTKISKASDQRLSRVQEISRHCLNLPTMQPELKDPLHIRSLELTMPGRCVTESSKEKKAKRTSCYRLAPLLVEFTSIFFPTWRCQSVLIKVFNDSSPDVDARNSSIRIRTTGQRL